MTNEMIEKYLEEHSSYTGPFFNDSQKSLLRNSLRDWIMVAWVYHSRWDLSVGKLATENIEASLGKPWSQVREELEGMDV